MLKILRRIVQTVTASSDLINALVTLVTSVRQAIGADAVSAYLLDLKHSEYVLVATDGLNPDAPFKVRFSIEEGLIGLVGRREEPINIEDASNHPAFLQDARLGEEGMKAFLGVPIIQHRRLYGVLMIQRMENRCFDDAEEAFLITLAAQLGGMIAHAEATGELARITIRGARAFQTEVQSWTLQGNPCVTGVGVGTAVVIYPHADIDAVPKQSIEDIEPEIAAFYDALRITRESMQRLGKRMSETLEEEERALFDVYIRILDDDNIGSEVEQEIRSQNVNAQWALACVVKRHINQFESMKDEYLRERASDFRDLGRRVLAALQSFQEEELKYPKRTILVGEEISAAHLAEVPEGHLVGIVSAKGSNTSHVSILARALNIPAVMGVRGLALDQLSRRALIVDGYHGKVFVSPSRQLLLEYKHLALQDDALNQSLVSLWNKPAETLDNYRVELHVNTGLAMDSGLSMSVGAEGVGLYRSEIPFMSRDRFPSEDEQYVIYRQVLKAFAPRSVTMRTLDIGGDKVLPYFPINEDNPYLGWRGIRITLDHPEVFLLQVRAMLRANEGLNNLRIMLPMVSSISEIDDAIKLIRQAYQELLEENCAIELPPLGVMIEVPSAVFLAKEFAKRVQFLSVGTNDLTQYLLAVDRNNARVAGLYDGLHPAMLHALLRIIESARSCGIEVSVCGEMAGDPLAVIILLGMGFNTLSMNSSSLPRVKWVIRSFTISEARRILTEVLSFEHTHDIRAHLQSVLHAHGLGALIRLGAAVSA